MTDVKNDSSFCDIQDFNLILVTSCDLQGVSRGRFVFRNSIEGVFRNGLGMAQAALFTGIRCDLPTSLTEYKNQGWTNGSLVPDISTLKPLSWISYGGQKAGHVLCELHDSRLQVEESSPRAVLRNQLNTLQNLGYEIKTSNQIELTLFHKGTTIPIGVHEDTTHLMSTLVTFLQSSGFPITSLARGLEAGKLQLCFDKQSGLEAADHLHRLRNTVRALCVRENYDVTFMTAPVDDVSGNGTHYWVTLLARDQRNAFTDENDSSALSELGRHWLAGILHHHSAIAALARPTMNCYREISEERGHWADKKHNRLQVRTNDIGVSIVDTLPSSASNPYITLSAIIAAGVDGIVNKLELPKQNVGHVSTTEKLPRSLEDALLSLEADGVLRNSLGSKFVERFLLIKREFEIKWAKENTNGVNNLEFERSLYLYNL